MTRSDIAIFIFFVAMFTSSGFAQPTDTIEELKACAGMTNQDARLACFDQLSQRVLREESADHSPEREREGRPEVATEAGTIVMSLPDELPSSKTVQYVGKITSCKKGQYDDWYFVFDNDQVWKKLSGRNLRFKECHFDATITRDAFGYKMRIEGEQGTIRVKRIR